MRVRILLVMLALVAGVVGVGVAQRAAGADPAALVGAWTVDLRPTPGAPPASAPFEVKTVDGTSFTGTFYGSEIRDGRVNGDWGAVHFAFTTYDGTGPYHHAGRLVDGRLEGTTNSVGRRFLAVWRAERTR